MPSGRDRSRRGAIVERLHCPGDCRDRPLAVLLQRARELGAPLVVPVGALAPAWRDGARQANLAQLLRAADVEVADLDAHLARAAGELCGRSQTSDVIDATVVLVARQRGGAVATGDAEDLLRLDPSLVLVRI